MSVSTGWMTDNKAGLQQAIAVHVLPSRNGLARGRVIGKRQSVIEFTPYRATSASEQPTETLDKRRSRHGVFIPCQYRLVMPSRGSASGGIVSGASGASSAGSDFHAAE